MTKVYLIAMAAAALLLAGVSFAGPVILVTDTAAVDASTAAAAANKAGVPIIVLEDGLLTEEAKADIRANFDSAIIVGGPVVVKPQVAQDLDNMGIKHARLWGFERTATAVAVARYFWVEGAGCAVLADDTRSDADFRRHSAAARLAARHNCTFLPVPEGTVPAEVLDLLKDLNITDVRFIGKRAHGISIAGINVKEISGSDEDVEKEEEKEAEKFKLVIVATPDWKVAIAIHAEPNNRSVVRHKTDTNVSGVIEFIRANNVTDVRVVGLPQLADEIAARLSEAGINVTKVSGRKADEISRELTKKHLSDWDEKRKHHEEKRMRMRADEKKHLARELNKTAEKLDALLAGLKLINSTAAAEAAAEIEAALAKVQTIQNAVDSGNLDDARAILHEIKFVPESVKLRFRIELDFNIEKEIGEEENAKEKKSQRIAAELSAASEQLKSVKAGCGYYAPFIDALQNEIESSGDTGMHRARLLSNQARHVLKACEKPPSVAIKEPKDGSTVAAPVEIELDVDNFNLVPAGKRPAAGEGHFHVFLDDREQRSASKKFIYENVAEGIHGIRVQLHLSDHTEIAGAYTQAVITVQKSGEKSEEKIDGKKSGRTEASQNVVRIIQSGYSSYLEPRNITVKKGSAVTWVNEDTERHWIASAQHPTHKAYPGSGIEKCGTEDAARIFDACEGTPPGANYTFVFEEAGSWRYHDHRNPALNGIVTVVG